ncbi:hypothetical protein [Marinobacter sp. MBR-105]|jgi:hypothetical protein
MNNRSVFFPVFHPKSELRNGLITTTGLSVDLVETYDFDSREHTKAIELAAINSKGSVSTGFLRIPAEEAVLRELAATFLTAADEVSGKDASSLVHQLTQQLEEATDRESVQESLDDLIYEVEANDKRASSINNQGIYHQVLYLIKKGYRPQLAIMLEELTGEPAQVA